MKQGENGTKLPWRNLLVAVLQVNLFTLLNRYILGT